MTSFAEKAGLTKGGSRRHPMTEYDEIMRSHRWEAHPVFNNIRWCAGCGLGMRPELDPKSGLAGASLMVVPGETHGEKRGGCGGQQPGEERSYFLVNPGTGGMDRVGIQDWLPRLRSIRLENGRLENGPGEDPEPGTAGAGDDGQRMRFLRGGR